MFGDMHSFMFLFVVVSFRFTLMQSVYIIDFHLLSCFHPHKSWESTVYCIHLVQETRLKWLFDFDS